MATSKARKKAILKRNLFLGGCAAVLALIVLAVVLLVNAIGGNGSTPAVKNAEKKTVVKGDSNKVVATATVVNTGDIMVHSTQLTGAKTGNGYDFSDFFKAVSPYFNGADFSVANLEVTFGSEQSGIYSGYPAFNTPDILADNIKDSGLKFLITANNHCYDTGLFGLKRTLDVLDTKKIPHTGTRKSESEKNYAVNNVNNIKIGMANFTYENTNASTPAGRKSLNGNIIASEANALVNSFSYSNLDKFYKQAENVIKNMKNDGAEAVVFYMHWGEEYQLSQNTWQKTIAQKLCNMGVDVIIGGHPHVIQPMEMLHSEDSQNTTLCIYSLGNAISNQRQEIMHPECTTGHTEDGLLFSYTFQKFGDGTVSLANVKFIPTWVDKYKAGNGYHYTIYPLENENFGADKYGLSGASATKSKASYNRTLALLSESFNKCLEEIKGK